MSTKIRTIFSDEWPDNDADPVPEPVTFDEDVWDAFNNLHVEVKRLEGMMYANDVAVVDTGAASAAWAEFIVTLEKYKAQES